MVVERDTVAWSMGRSKWMILPLGLVLLLLAQGIALLFRVSPAVSLWFPPAGVSIALGLWLGLPGVGLTGLAAVIMAPAWGYEGWTRWAGLTDMLEPLVAWLLYRYGFRGSLTLNGMNSVTAFLLSAPLTACLTSAIVGCLTLFMLGKIPESVLGETIQQWWLGNAIGTMTLTPLALLVLTSRLRQWGWLRLSEQDVHQELIQNKQQDASRLQRYRVELALLFGSVVYVTILTVQATQNGILATLQFSLLSAIPVIWAAVRLGALGGVAIASFSIIATVINYLLVYPQALLLSRLPIDTHLLHTHQFSLLLQAIVALLVGTAVTERVTAKISAATEQVKQTEQKLRQRQHFIQRVTDTVSGILYVYDLQEQRNIYVNRQVGETLGYSAETIQAMGDTLSSQLMHPDDLRRLPAQLEQIYALQDGEFHEFEFRLRHANGEWRWMSDRLTIFHRIATGMPSQTLGCMQDITERKRIETALWQANERFQLATAAINGMIYDLDVAQGRVERTPGLMELLGYAPDEVPSTNEWWSEQIHPDDRSQLPTTIAETPTINGRRTLEYRIRHKDGHYIYVMDQCIVLADASGAPIRVVGNTTNVSERKQTEQALRESEERLRLALTAANQGLYDLNVQTGAAIISPEYARMLGYDPDEFQETNANWRERLHPDDWQRVDQVYGDYLAGRRSDYKVEFRQRTRSGDWKWILSQGKIVDWDEAGQPLRMLGTHTDITELKRAEAALRYSEARSRRLVDANLIGIMFVHYDGRITEANEAFLTLTGYTQQDLEAGQIDWRTLTPPEYVAQDEQKIEEIRTFGRCVPFEKEYVRKDGSRIPVLLGVARLLETTDECVCFVLDLTERKRIEAERAAILQREQVARHQAETASRMKDEFLAIVSHELRSPLNAILGWSRLLRTRTFDADTTEKALASIERNAQAQTQLIEDLLDISRIIRGTIRLNLCPIKLTTVIQSALDTVRPTASAKSIQLNFLSSVEVGLVSGDPERLQQIIWNLLSNAVKFTPEGGQVDVRLDRVGLQARIQVIDTGKGINPDFLPYVFERFRQADATTTRTQGGLGLGLAIVRNLAELHGGMVQATSAGEEQGSTFTVFLPLLPTADGEAEQDDGASSDLSDPIPSLQGVQVLVVDDEADTREFLIMALQQFGAQATAAASVKEALAVFQQNPPDVVLSDIGMPDADGYSLIRTIRSLSPEAGGQTPAAALTAYVRGEDRLQALAAGFQLHVPKPIEPLQLLKVVAQLAHRS